MTTWQSSPIQLSSGVIADTKADAEGGTLGFMADGTLLIDAHMTSDEMRSVACILIECADKSDEAARGQA